VPDCLKGFVPEFNESYTGMILDLEFPNSIKYIIAFRCLAATGAVIEDMCADHRRRASETFRNQQVHLIANAVA